MPAEAGCIAAVTLLPAAAARMPRRVGGGRRVRSRAQSRAAELSDALSRSPLFAFEHLLYTFPSQSAQHPGVMLTPGAYPLDRELDDALERADGMRRIGFRQRQHLPFDAAPQAAQTGFSAAFFICTQ